MSDNNNRGSGSGNNSGRNIDPSKSSGSSPPIGLEGDLGSPVAANDNHLLVGSVYELTQDYRPPSKSKKARSRTVVFEKGTRFVVTENMSLRPVSDPTRGGSGGGAFHPDSGEYGRLVPFLRLAPHDCWSVLSAAGVAGDSAVEVLAQLWTLDKVSTGDVRRAATLVDEHDKALEIECDRQDVAQVVRIAMAVAKDVHENNFSSPRGVYAIEDRTLVCVYDNDSWTKAPALRELHLQAVRVALESNGYRVFAAAQYPATGDNAGSTRTVLVRAFGGEYDAIAIRRIIQSEVDTVLEKLQALQ